MGAKVTKVGQKLYLNYYDSDKGKVIKKEAYAAKINVRIIEDNTKKLRLVADKLDTIDRDTPKDNWEEGK